MRGRLANRLVPTLSNLHPHPLMLALAVFTVHYLVFRHYFVDDAGITFASARTLVEHGRFSIDQFAETVEAYSNPLWMLLLAGWRLAGFDILIAAKLVNWILGATTLGLVYVLNSRYGYRVAKSSTWINTASPMILAFMTGFVVWGAAGLENALYGLLTAALVYAAIRFEHSSYFVPFVVTAFLLGVTRPEGILLGIFAWSGLLLSPLAQTGAGRTRLLWSLVALLGLYSLFLLSRYVLFATVLPNTYYAKLSSSLLTNLMSGLYYIAVFARDYWSIVLILLALLSLVIVHELPSAQRPVPFVRNSTHKTEDARGYPVAARLRYSLHTRLSHPHKHRIVRHSTSIVAILCACCLLCFGGAWLMDRLLVAAVTPSDSRRAIVAIVIIAVSTVTVSVLFMIVRRRGAARALKYLTSTESAMRSILRSSLIRYSVLLVAANLIYVAYVGGTWGVARFLTPSLICLSLLLAELLKHWDSSRIRSRDCVAPPVSQAMRLVALGLAAFFVYQMATNTLQARNTPPVPFYGIADRHADFGNELGAYLIDNGYLPNAKHIPYMVPDIGATAYYAENYTVIDSACLASVPFAVARNRQTGTSLYDSEFFRQYVFGTVKPILIETHLWWSYVSAIGTYTEFAQHYVLAKGPGWQEYMGQEVPNGYFVRTDLFTIEAEKRENTLPEAIDGWSQRLLLNDWQASALTLSADGIFDLSTTWRTGSAECSNELLDAHSLEIELVQRNATHVIACHQIAGGYYLPSRWEPGTAILDKCTVKIPNIAAGEYGLWLKLTYPDGVTDIVDLCSVQVAPRRDLQLCSIVEEFRAALAAGGYPAADGALQSIRAVDPVVADVHLAIYIQQKLAEVNRLIDRQLLLEAYETLSPFVGTTYQSAETRTLLSLTASDLSERLEESGRHLEAAGQISGAIGLYEKCMWLNPDNSHLRRHIEEIRPTQWSQQPPHRR
ncbi:MAG: hypothetical protein JXA58_08585 [Dehalococcoidia bacterium]|nr:hypothetical protein [Dehalococcoidia bacterium]